MRCIACGRVTSTSIEDTCTTCALQAEREASGLQGDTSVEFEYCHVGGQTVEIRGLPPRVRIDDTVPEQPDKSVADSILYAPDVQHEFIIRHGGHG